MASRDSRPLEDAFLGPSTSHRYPHDASVHGGFQSRCIETASHADRLIHDYNLLMVTTAMHIYTESNESNHVDFVTTTALECPKLRNVGLVIILSTCQGWPPKIQLTRLLIAFPAR